jgi:hypothetical protein
MVAIVNLGNLMRLPRLQNSLSGWHKAAWFGVPLVLLSPLTGLARRSA